MGVLFFPPLFLSSISLTGVFLEDSAVYRIVVQGAIPEGWGDRLGGMHIMTVSGDQTTLEGWLPDQAALKGVLDTLYNLHLRVDIVTRQDISGRCHPRIT